MFKVAPLTVGRPGFKPGQSISFIYFWFHHEACGILVLWPGMEPLLPSLGSSEPAPHWTSRKSPVCLFKLHDSYKAARAEEPSLPFSSPPWLSLTLCISVMARMENAQCRLLALQAPGRSSDTIPQRVTFHVVLTHKYMYLETEIQ